MRLLASLLACIFLAASASATSFSAQRINSTVGSGADECSGDDFGNSGTFDFFILAQSWSAEFCYSHTTYPGCQSPTSYMKSSLTIHGMWPNYAQTVSNHGWPQCCTDTKYGFTISQSTVSLLLPEFQLYWPNEQDPSGSDLTESLWYHEWQVHGTCSGLAQVDYFQTALDLHVALGTPSLLTSNVGGSVSRDALFAAYGETDCTEGGSCQVGFTCQAGQYLDGVITCYDNNFKRIVCPAFAVGTWSCTSSTIQVTAF